MGHFSAVSVPEKFGKRGIGKSLVQAAEQQLIIELGHKENELQEVSSSFDGIPSRVDVNVSMEMGVINLRTDLFPWYQSQGYQIEGEIRPNDTEITRIILDNMDVCCVLMKKVLVSRQNV